MECKIRLKKTGKIVYCDYQFDPKTKKRMFYVSPDSTDMYDEENVEIIPQEPYELFGVECGDGWKGLLAPIFEYIEKYNEGKEEEEKITPLQVKEKFGGLRFYVNSATDELDKLIDAAEEASYKTCETCGSTSNVGQTDGWITTLCHDCVKKLADRKENGSITWRNCDTGKRYIISADAEDKEIN